MPPSFVRYPLKNTIARALGDEPTAPAENNLSKILFLQALRRQRAEASLEEVAEVAGPEATAWMEAVELRGVIDRLPLEEREVLLLHYLEGYTSAEIAPILRAPASTVRCRLAQARERLRQELGEGDLTYAMRLRWHKEGEWLQFRSVSFYDDRRKEVPNRLLARWTAARQQRHFLVLDDLIEIAQLSDARQARP